LWAILNHQKRIFLIKEQNQPHLTGETFLEGKDLGEDLEIVETAVETGFRGGSVTKEEDLK
jgi:hypothetical protein